MPKNLPTTGFFVDWNGDVRRVEAPGDGYRCEVVQRNGYIGVDVIGSDDGVDFEAVFWASLDALTAAGVEVRFASGQVNYGFGIGDLVTHIKDPGLSGVVTELDSANDQGGVTTCRVAWGAKSLAEACAIPREEQDVQWTNKLVKSC